jgi:hypothetical protein
MLTEMLFSELRRGTAALVLTATIFCIAGCASMDILAPGANSTNISPVPTDVFWNSDAHQGSIQVTLDGANNITSQFAIPSTAANNHATANLNLTPGGHTLAVSGTFWDGWNQKYTTQSNTATFQVSSGPGRPVTYTMTVFGWMPGWPAGSLGNISFGGQDPTATNREVNLIFTFEGNTNDVLPYTAPCGVPDCYHHSISPGVGFEIVAGEASILIQDATSGATIAQATFLPVAKIFVSVDNGNGGIGFGSLGAVPSDPAFPDHGIEVAYPYAQFNAAFTDLKSNYTRNADWALSCTGFNGSPGQADPHGCNVPPSLATTAGLLPITSNDYQDTAPQGTVSATFTTVVH